MALFSGSGLRTSAGRAMIPAPVTPPRNNFALAPDLPGALAVDEIEVGWTGYG
jgi:hypothetical protein